MRGQLSRNIAANAIGAALSSVAAVASAPLIFRVLGPEAYGLVGVYLLAQGLMPLFDLGVTPALARAIAWHRGKGESGAIVTLLRLAHLLLLFLSLAFVLVVALGADALAHTWLKPQEANGDEISLALILMAAALAVRMLGVLNRAALMAMERQPTANLIQTLAALSRTFGALAFCFATDSGILGFLAFQLPVSVVEWLWCSRALNGVLPDAPVPVSREQLLSHGRFALRIASLSALWLASSQIDKIVLSKVLPLDEYGAFSLGAHLAAVVPLGVGAVHGAIQPRLTRLYAAGEDASARHLYGLATAITIGVAAALLAALLLGGSIWLPLVSAGSATDLDSFRVGFWYAFGHIGLGVLGLAYILQSAKGVLGLHAAMTALHTSVLIPVVLTLADESRVIELVASCAVVHWLFVLLWLPLTHQRFLAGGHWGWLRRDLLPSTLAVAAILAGLWSLGVIASGPWSASLIALLGALVVLAAACLANADFRSIARGWLERQHA